MAIELIDKIKPKNGGSFPMVDATDVLMPDGKRLNECEFGGGGATEEQLEQIQKNKTAIENIGKTMAGGTSGQFATSDGKGGIAWVTVTNGNEVAY